MSSKETECSSELLGETYIFNGAVKAELRDTLPALFERDVSMQVTATLGFKLTDTDEFPGMSEFLV